VTQQQDLIFPVNLEGKTNARPNDFYMILVIIYNLYIYHSGTLANNQQIRQNTFLRNLTLAIIGSQPELGIGRIISEAESKFWGKCHQLHSKCYLYCVRGPSMTTQDS
jgi:hypothetical protein